MPDLPPFVDLHGDILYDATHRRLYARQQQVLKQRHLPHLRRGNIKIQVLPIYYKGLNLPEAALRQTILTANTFLEEMDEASDTFAVIKTKKELTETLNNDKIGVILAMEGAEGLGREVNLVRLFFELGLRMLSLTWNRANALAEGCAEDTGAGLSLLGRELVAALADYPVILDVSHLNQAGFWSALKYCSGPVLASHSNSAEVWPHQRNLTDDQIKALAERGGLIGLNFYPEFVAEADTNLFRGLLSHAEHIANLVGVKHLALGPDFIDYLPGPTVFEPEESARVEAGSRAAPSLPGVAMLPDFYRALLDRFSKTEAALVMGGNALRFLSGALPANS